ncbi:MAG: metallophosphoesterase, partial [Victivallaceae bacterium]|nr:metallophosphoesterase [Victivallaceae bacterium]
MEYINPTVGILHLSDIHFKSRSDIILSRQHSIANAIKSNCYHIQKLYIVVSGDIAFSGKAEEYEIALDFFLGLQDHLCKECQDIKIQFLLTPGNHDCDFTKQTVQRENNLKVIFNKGYSAIDEAVIESCTQIQKDFFEFVEIFDIDFGDKLCYFLEDTIAGNKIRFICYNTAWLSEKKETPGILFFPIREIEDHISDDCLTITVFHHPSNWLTPNSSENNSKEFSKAIRKTSNIILSGHEHSDGQWKNIDMVSLKESILLEAGVLQVDNLISRFNFISVDMIGQKAEVLPYGWSEDSRIYSAS